MGERTRFLGSKPAKARTAWAGALLAIFVIHALFASRVHAQDRRTATLVYRSPGESASCPNERAFRDLIATRLGYDPFSGSNDLSIEVTMTHRGDFFIGDVTARNGEGRVTGRRDGLRESQCESLASSLAVAVSILVDPFGTMSATPSPSPASTPPPAAVETPNNELLAPPPPPPRATRDNGAHFVAQAHVIGALASLPAASIAGSLSFGAAWRRLILLGEARIDLMPSLAQTDLAQIDASLFTFGPTACGRFGLITVCGGVQLGQLQGRSPDVVDPALHSNFVALADLRAMFEVPLGDEFSLLVGAEARIPIVRVSMIVDERTVWTMNAAALGLRLGVSWVLR